MKPLLSFAALFLLLTPALAQQVDQPASDPAQQASAATEQPATEQAATEQPGLSEAGLPQAGLSQADALAAAQAAEEQSAQSAGDQSGVQSNPEQYPDEQPAAAQPNAPPPSAEAAPAQPYGAEQGGEQDAVQQPPAGQPPADQSQTVQPYDQPNHQPRPERRTLQVSPLVRPRAEAAAYPVYRQQPQLSVGAKLLSAREVEQKFSTPLGKHYLVVEVAVFPVGAVKLRPEDFTLRAGSDDQAFFPSAPEDIARVFANSGPAPRRGGIFPSMGVGYQNGPWGRGVSTGVGVGVAGGPRPYPRGAMDANRRVIENELRDKSLPEGSLTQPVAGYLYFPVKQKRNAHYNLELTRNGETLSLPLPASND
jgi:hypothetical protein